MFSSGHLLWIAISALLIVGGIFACIKRKPDIDQMLTVCLGIAVISEIVKILSVVNILPMVTPTVDVANATLDYVATGQYTPYIEMAHIPLELCSLQIVFIAAALWSKDDKWKRRFLSIIYATGVIGGILGIVLAYVTVDYTTVQSYFVSPRIWQFFFYHAMVVTLGLYVGICSDKPFSYHDFKGVVAALLSMDVISMYLNSVFSQAVYVAEKPVGLVYRANFFSSYMNPIGLVLTEKWQWMVYLLIRFAIAVVMISTLFIIQRAAWNYKHKNIIN
ncbi:MAG: YwaF family protein [Erysipelotrichaceae bacterium]|nr:YwaF family protein [Erysipelotrichaceae bacterium]